MRPRRRILLVVAGFALAAVLVPVLWPRDHGPIYQSKTLEEWLELCDVDDEPTPEALKAPEAVRHIGTNGLPFLLKRINHERPAWKLKLLALVPRALSRRAPHAMSRLFGDPGDGDADQAANAFAILGQEAIPAIPALTNLLSHQEHWNTSLRALKALSYIGTNGLNIVVGIVTNTSYPDTHRFVALDNISTLGTNAICVLPALIYALNDDTMGPQVTVTLGKLKLQPDLVVPALAKCLQSGELLLPESAAEALGEYGPQAAAAVPELLIATTNPEADLRIAATNALQAIASEALKKIAH